MIKVIYWWWAQILSLLFCQYGCRHCLGADIGDKSIWKLFAFPVATESERGKGSQARAGQDKGKEHISEGFLPLRTTSTS